LPPLSACRSVDLPVLRVVAHRAAPVLLDARLPAILRPRMRGVLLRGGKDSRPRRIKEEAAQTTTTAPTRDHASPTDDNASQGAREPPFQCRRTHRTGPTLSIFSDRRSFRQIGGLGAYLRQVSWSLRWQIGWRRRVQETLSASHRRPIEPAAFRGRRRTNRTRTPAAPAAGEAHGHPGRVAGPH